MKEEMVLLLILDPIIMPLLKEIMLVSFIVCILLFFAGRGVDLNRNWSVDWGKKEKVSH